jgi:beta-glucosidase
VQKKLKDITSLRNKFPKSFLWGASVASHQVEGRNNNQWTKWEHETAARQAKTAEDRLGSLDVWPDIKKQASNPHNYVSGLGVDHYTKYQLDFALAKKLHLNAMRSGVEWSRISPKEGMIDTTVLKHYVDYFASMKRLGLEPFVNIFHWTLPEWFVAKGGFEKKENLRYWQDFIHVLLEHLDFSIIRYVIVINEANTYASMGYAVGEFPPGKKDYLQSVRVYRNLARAHKLAYDMIKSVHPKTQVGSAHQCNAVVGHGILGYIASKTQEWYWNWSWLKWSKKHDFVGINYYFTDHWDGIRPDVAAAPKGTRYPKSDLGWYMNPGGIEEVIRGVAKRYKDTPIVITENGLADQKDQYREWWLHETIEAMSRCMHDKLPLVGYLHWSLLDNFEWQFGWWPKFGLIEVDRKTMQRTVRKSARIWSAWLGS